MLLELPVATKYQDTPPPWLGLALHCWTGMGRLLLLEGHLFSEWKWGEEESSINGLPHLPRRF